MPSNFIGETRTCRARKQYKCEWCGQRIEKSELHKRTTARWDGDFQCFRLHLECSDALSRNRECEDGFTPFGNERPEAGVLVVTQALRSIQVTHIGT